MQIPDYGLQYVSQKPEDKSGALVVPFPSASVLGSLDGVTDDEVSLKGGEGDTVGLSEEGMRWATAEGAVLKIGEQVNGYASFMWWDSPGEQTRRKAVSFNLGASGTRYTFTPLALPLGAEALQFVVRAPNDDFLIPGGQPLAFGLTCHNLTSAALLAFRCAIT